MHLLLSYDKSTYYISDSLHFLMMVLVVNSDRRDLNISMIDVACDILQSHSVTSRRVFVWILHHHSYWILVVHWGLLCTCMVMIGSLMEYMRQTTWWRWYDWLARHHFGQGRQVQVFSKNWRHDSPCEAESSYFLAIDNQCNYMNKVAVSSTSI